LAEPAASEIADGFVGSLGFHLGGAQFGKQKVMEYKDETHLAVTISTE
jgi:hypothetical protein